MSQTYLSSFPPQIFAERMVCICSYFVKLHVSKKTEKWRSFSLRLTGVDITFIPTSDIQQSPPNVSSN